MKHQAIQGREWAAEYIDVTDIDWFSGAMNFISASFRDRFRKRR